MPRVAMCGHGTGQIDPVHQASPEQCAQWIGIVRKNDLSHFRLGVADGARIEQHSAVVHVVLARSAGSHRGPGFAEI